MSFAMEAAFPPPLEIGDFLLDLISLSVAFTPKLLLVFDTCGVECCFWLDFCGDFDLAGFERLR